MRIRDVSEWDLWRYSKPARRVSFEVAEGLYARGWITGMGKVTPAGGEVLGAYLLRRQIDEMSDGMRRAVRLIAVDPSSEALAKLHPNVRGAMRLRGWLGPKGLTRKGREIADLLLEGWR
jgi:hypothetical protein